MAKDHAFNVGNPDNIGKYQRARFILFFKLNLLFYS